MPINVDSIRNRVTDTRYGTPNNQYSLCCEDSRVQAIILIESLDHILPNVVFSSLLLLLFVGISFEGFIGDEELALNRSD